MKKLFAIALGLLISVSTAFAGGNNEESTQKAVSVKSVKKERMSSPKFKNTHHFEKANVAEFKVNVVKKEKISSPEFKNTRPTDVPNESSTDLVVKKNNLKGPRAKNYHPGRD